MATRKLKIYDIVRFAVTSVDREYLIGEIVRDENPRYYVWVEGYGTYQTYLPLIKKLTSEEEMLWRLEK